MKLLRIALGLVVISGQAVACPNVDNALELTTASKNSTKAFLSYDFLAVSVPLSMTIEFCNKKTDTVSNIDFDAIMPAHQHGMNYKVELIAQKDHMYQVDNVVFHMPGIWRIQINAETQTDTVNYSTDIVVK